MKGRKKTEQRNEDVESLLVLLQRKTEIYWKFWSLTILVSVYEKPGKKRCSNAILSFRFLDHSKVCYMMKKLILRTEKTHTKNKIVMNLFSDWDKLVNLSQSESTIMAILFLVCVTDNDRNMVFCHWTFNNFPRKLSLSFRIYSQTFNIFHPTKFYFNFHLNRNPRQWKHWFLRKITKKSPKSTCVLIYISPITVC